MGDINYRPLIDGMVWSYSRIKAFSECPYQWFMKYLLHIKGDDQFYSSYGTFVHSILARFYRGELDQGSLLTEFLTHFSDEVLGERPPPETVRKYIQSGKDYFGNFKPLPYKTLAVERKIYFQIRGIPFVGILDYIGEDKRDGSLVIVDHKSRYLKPRETPAKPKASDAQLDEMLKQLYIYSAAVRQFYGDFPKTLCFNCFRSGILIEEPFHIKAYDEALDWAVKEIEKIKNAQDFPPYYDYFRCRYLCDLKDRCCFFQMMDR